MGNPVRLPWVVTAARMRPPMRLTLLCVLLAATVGCGKEIGDACIVNTDCDPGCSRLCDTGPKEGYCTIQGCDYNTCPEEAACVRLFTGQFDNKPCEYTTEGTS